MKTITCTVRGSLTSTWGVNPKITNSYIFQRGGRNINNKKLHNSKY